MNKIRKMVLFIAVIFCGILLINISLSGTSCPTCFEYGPAFQVCQDWCDFYWGVDCFDVAPPNCDCIGGGDCYCSFWFYCEDEHYAKRSLTFGDCPPCE